MNEREYVPDLDLGSGHSLTWLVAGAEDRTPVGAVIRHPPGPNHPNDGPYCEGTISWAPTVWEREHPDRLSEHERNRARWTLSGEVGPQMTLAPSILCSCGDHGYIRDGKWVSA